MTGRILIFLAIAIGSLGAIIALGWLAEQVEAANAARRQYEVMIGEPTSGWVAFIALCVLIGTAAAIIIAWDRSIP